MVDYLRMGNIAVHLGNAMPTISLHQLREMWESSRWTVIRIQALAVVAIIISFFLAAFGSCRRWSNRWIFQKGFFAAHALSLSLGAYSIGLMQSSSVKSEMYPIWTVSLFTLFGCIDPVTAYSGLDYKGPLSKVVFGICLNFGYVLLISISTMSGVFGKISISVLSAITFIKGFHRSLALVHQSRRRNQLQIMGDLGHTLGNIDKVEADSLKTQLPFKDVWVAKVLSHSLQRHFLGLGNDKPDLEALVEGVDYKWAMKVIEVELVFLYDALFTGNEFLYFFQAKAGCLWALASFIGICFVGVAVASPETHSRGSSQVVDTTTADLVITFVILMSLALLQLMHLVRCWTSNWARISIRFDAVMHKKGRSWRQGWISLRMFVATSTNWFDKQLWQDKIGQYSALPPDLRYGIPIPTTWRRRWRFKSIRRIYLVLGLHYVADVLRDLLGGDTHKSSAVRLGDKVKIKESIIEFLGQIRSDRLDGDWWFSFPCSHHPSMERYLPYSCEPHFMFESHGYKYTSCVMVWHTTTWYLEQADTARGGRRENKKISSKKENEIRRNRRVAIALSKYCTYLVVSAPELLPGPSREVSRAYSDFVKSARVAVLDSSARRGLLDAMSDPETLTKLVSHETENWQSTVSTARQVFWPHGSSYETMDPLLWDGVGLANQLLLDGGHVDHWKTLALVWVRLLLYAAPYGNVEAHVQRLAQGGEFITHLWALLFHLNIREWKLPETVPNITTVEHADGILKNDGQIIVVAFLDSLFGNDSDELAIVSKVECGVKFYKTSSPDVAKFFNIDQAAKLPVLLFLNNREKTLYDGEFRALAIARFLNPNKFPLANQARNSTQRSEDTKEIEDPTIIEEVVVPLA